MDHNGSYTMMVKPMKTLELHYPMIQLLIMTIIEFSTSDNVILAF